MKIRTRLILFISLATLIVLSGFTAVTSYIQYRDENSRFLQKIELHKRMIPELFGTLLWNLDKEAIKANAEAIASDSDIEELTVLDERKEPIFAKAKKPLGRSISVDMNIDFENRNIGRVALVYTKSNMDKTIRESMTRSAIVILLLLIVIDAIVSLIAFSITKPLYGVIEAVNTIGSGDFEQPLRIRAYGELGVLVDAINAMNGELKKRESQIREITEESLKNEMKYRLEAQKLEIEKTEHRISDQLRNELEQSLNNLKHTQEQLVLSEKMAMLGRLVAGVAHEINTPLGIGVTAASYLEEQAVEFSKELGAEGLRRSSVSRFVNSLNESTKILTHNLHRAADIISSFKQVSVDQTSEFKREFDIEQYIEEVVQSLHPRIKHTKHIVKIDCDENLTISSYPGAISQILTNLMMNSLVHAFASVENGVMVIKVSLQKGNIIELDYSDNGCGIPSDELTHLFDPFRTSMRNSGGSGLGTYIVYNIVTQKLQGTIRAESELGKGLRYIIRFGVDVLRGKLATIMNASVSNN